MSNFVRRPDSFVFCPQAIKVQFIDRPRSIDRRDHRNMASATQTTTPNTNNSAMNSAAATMILSQFDQKTQLQALEMLRQLNAQQQLQQYQQLAQLRDLQTQAHIHAQAAAAAARVTTNGGLVVISEKAKAGGSSGDNSDPAVSSIGSSATASHASGSGSSSSGASSKDVASEDETSAVAEALAIGPDGEQYVIPDDDLADQIVGAAEHYFSDDNLIKDHYLLRQICQKSEGFLSLKLLTALKTIKRLTKDWRVTSYALEKSSKLLRLNAEKTKVKRIAVLPEHVLNARQITSVIAIKIPLDFSSVRQITQMFAEFGKISLVRVLMPGRQVPCDLRNYATQVPDMGTTLCAIVEYETENEACFACRELNARKLDSGMRSALLGPRLKRNLYKSPADLEASEMAKLGAGHTLNPIQSGPGATRMGRSDGPSGWRQSVSNQRVRSSEMRSRGDSVSDGRPIRFTGKDSGESRPKNFDRAPGAGRKSAKINITINSTTGSILRQPRGPAGGTGFVLKRSLVV